MKTTLSLKKLNKHTWSSQTLNGLFLVPTQYLFDISNQNATGYTDIGDGSDRVFSTEAVFKRILKETMRDPLYVIVYLPNHNINNNQAKIRLEAGNHRVRAALEMGISHLPVAAFVSSNPYFSEGNGTHLFDINRQDVLKVVNRNNDEFEPYPHPIDLKELLKHLDIYYSKHINITKEANGIIEFE